MKYHIIFVSLICIHSASIVMVTGLTDLLENTPLYSFDPAKLEGLVENSEQQVQVSCNRSLSVFRSVTLKVVSADPDIAEVSSDRLLFQCEPLSGSNESYFVVRGQFLGRTVVSVKTLNATHSDRNVHGLPLTVLNDSYPVVDYHVAVVRKERFIDHLFLALVSFMVICANVGMGCKIDPAVVKEVLTKPVAPAIGFSCQYVIMPLVCALKCPFFLCISNEMLHLLVPPPLKIVQKKWKNWGQNLR